MAITFDDFKKLEIKIGKVISAEKVLGADKLIKFVFDLGTEERQVLAGLAEVFADPSELIGKEMPILVNIEPRKIRGYESQGMVMVAIVDDKPILLRPEKEVPPGSIIR